MPTLSEYRTEAASAIKSLQEGGSISLLLARKRDMIPELLFAMMANDEFIELLKNEKFKGNLVGLLDRLHSLNILGRILPNYTAEQQEGAVNMLRIAITSLEFDNISQVKDRIQKIGETKLKNTLANKAKTESIVKSLTDVQSKDTTKNLYTKILEQIPTEGWLFRGIGDQRIGKLENAINLIVSQGAQLNIANLQHALFQVAGIKIILQDIKDKELKPIEILAQQVKKEKLEAIKKSQTTGDKAGLDETKPH